MGYLLSPSSLSLLKECPRCFWLQLKKSIRRPAGIFPSLPSGIDGVLKAHFDSYMNKGQLPPELKELHGVRLFSDHALLSEWRNNRKGVRWADPHGNVVMGAVDNLLVKGKKLIVMDYKTRGYPLKEDTAGYYRDQMDIYNFLLRKKGYDTEDYSYLLFYHPTKVSENGDIIFHTDLVKIETSVGNAETIIREALDVLAGPMPKPAEDCGYCKWREIEIG